MFQRPKIYSFIIVSLTSSKISGFNVTPFPCVVFFFCVYESILVLGFINISFLTVSSTYISSPKIRTHVNFIEIVILDPTKWLSSSSFIQDAKFHRNLMLLTGFSMWLISHSNICEMNHDKDAKQQKSVRISRWLTRHLRWP